MNVADANRLESGFHHIGLENTEDVNNADIIVLNSCVVRQSAEDKVHGMLSSLRHIKDTHPTKIIALMGCLVGPTSEKLQLFMDVINLVHFVLFLIDEEEK